MKISTASAAAFQETIESGGIAIFPTDTLYGIACDPNDERAIERIHELKGRPPRKPSAVMYFTAERLIAELATVLKPAELELIEQLLPGPYTLVVDNAERRFAPSCAGTPDKLGLRVPSLNDDLAALALVTLPVLQTSANLSGGSDVTSVGQIEPAITAGVDLVLDGGPLPGHGSTVADISELSDGRWYLLREQYPGAGDRIAELTGLAPK